MFSAILSFFTANLMPILTIAANLLPVLSMARSMNDPAVTNAGLLNTMKAIQFVQPIVMQIEAVSAAGPKMSGPDKLQLFQTFVAEAYQAANGAGVDNKFTEALPLLNAAVAAVCAQMKISTVTLASPTSLPSPATQTVAPASALQNNA